MSAETMIQVALCVVCQMHDEGIDLTDEQIAELRSVHSGGTTLSMAAAYPDQMIDPLVASTNNETETQVGRMGYIFRAIVSSFREAIKTAPKKIPASKQIATAKQRKRIFEQPLDKE